VLTQRPTPQMTRTTHQRTSARRRVFIWRLRCRRAALLLLRGGGGVVVAACVRVCVHGKARESKTRWGPSKLTDLAGPLEFLAEPIKVTVATPDLFMARTAPTPHTSKIAHACPI